MMKEIYKSNTAFDQQSIDISSPSSKKEEGGIIYFGRSIRKTILTPYSKSIQIAAISESQRVPKIKKNSPDLALSALLRGLSQSRARIISFALQDAIKFANQVTQNYIETKEPDLLPCNLEVAVLDNNHLHIATVGESEIFLLKDGKVKWLQTKSSISAEEKKMLIGTTTNITPRNLSLSASSALDTGFNGIKLNENDKVMLCSSKVIEQLIEKKPNYFDEIKRFIANINQTNYHSCIEAWIEQINMPIELPSMPPLLVLFPTRSKSENGLAVNSNENGKTNRVQTKPTQAPIKPVEPLEEKPKQVLTNDMSNQRNHVMSDRPAFAQEIQSNEGEFEVEQEDIKKATDKLSTSQLEEVKWPPVNNASNGVDQSESVPSDGFELQKRNLQIEKFSEKAAHRAPDHANVVETEKLTQLSNFDILPENNLEMTRQSPVQTALAAFPLMDSPITIEDEPEVSAQESRLTSVQIFFSIFIVITLTILLSVILSVIWSEFRL